MIMPPSPNIGGGTCPPCPIGIDAPELIHITEKSENKFTVAIIQEITSCQTCRCLCSQATLFSKPFWVSENNFQALENCTVTICNITP